MKSWYGFINQFNFLPLESTLLASKIRPSFVIFTPSACLVYIHSTSSLKVLAAMLIGRVKVRIFMPTFSLSFLLLVFIWSITVVDYVVMDRLNDSWITRLSTISSAFCSGWTRVQPHVCEQLHKQRVSLWYSQETYLCHSIRQHVLSSCCFSQPIHDITTFR